MDGDNSGAVCLLEPYNHWGIILYFPRGLPYKVRNFRLGRGSVREEDERFVLDLSSQLER
jgi:hypothetical protein